MKKKIIAISLITSMVICNSMTVWAADTWSGNNNYSKGSDGSNSADRVYADDSTIDQNSGEKDVKASFTISNTPSYNVTITWGDMSFEPIGTLQSSWQEEYYAITGFEGWQSDGNTVTVTNKSNRDIKLTLQGEVKESYKDNYIITANKKTSADLKFSGSYGIATSYNKIISINGLSIKSPATYTADITSNEFVATVDVDAALEKSLLPQVTDLEIGTITLTISE